MDIAVLALHNQAHFRHERATKSFQLR